MIRRVLVANRGEIASRVFRTCRRLGIGTVAVHSDADAGLPYVREADHAVRLAGTAPGETYLDVGLLLDAARRSGADAVHPGYGFLSENADFARSVIEAGLTWIGPAPESIEAMGSKIEAKRIMRDAGVPVLTTWTEQEIGRQGASVGPRLEAPVLVKASAGGGGRGMRIVHDLGDLEVEIATAEVEATKAFGDGAVFVEPYVERGRHVEVQVIGHAEGIVVLGERDCSIQRRHQKVIEEAPAPDLPGTIREALHEAAREAAAAIGYRGAGTVEFLYDPASGRFWFLEMNTRLQVEHPVTELTHGVDLVEMQLAVAEGRAVCPTTAQGPVSGTRDVPGGHAIEARLYAEDPAADYAPQGGVLSRFDIPDEPGIRVDAGYESGSEVSTHYDAMLAKVICHAPTRVEAARKLAAVLGRARVHGVVTNRDLLVAILRDRDFLGGDLSTAFLDEHTLGAPAADAGAPVAAAIALAERTAASRTVQRGIPVAWRNVVSQPQVAEFAGDVRVEWRHGRDGYAVDGLTVVAASDDRVTLESDGVRTTYSVAVTGDAVDVDSPNGHVRLTRAPRFADPAEAVASGSLLAPMPGTVVSVAVESGAAVALGQPVLVLEAMKMQHTITAPRAGVVTEVDATPGAQVAAGDVLAVIEGEDA